MKPNLMAGRSARASAGAVVASQAVASGDLAGVHECPREVAISSVCITTRDRPIALSRCLKALRDDVESGARSRVIRVYDDSDNREAAIAAVKGQAQRNTIYYAGRRERLLYAERLAEESSLNKEVILFALRSRNPKYPSYGVNQNAMLFDSIGTAMMALDDDVIVKGVTGRFGTKATVTSGFDAYHYRLHESMASACEHARVGQGSLIDVHELFLSRSVSDIGRRLGGVSYVPAELERAKFMNAATMSVALTMTGIVGHHTCDVPPWVFMKGPVQRQLFRSDSAYHQLRDCKHVSKSVRRVIVSSAPYFVSACCGLWNHDGLVPFFPYFRNQDGVFAALMRRVYSRFVTAHLPVDVIHAPTSERRLPSTMADVLACMPRVSDLLISAIDYDPDDRELQTPDDALRSVGGWMMTMAGWTDLKLQEWLRGEAHEYARRRHGWAVMLRDNAEGAPLAWVRDLNRAVERAREARESRALELPELKTIGQPGKLLPSVRLLLRQFGALIENWPVITRAARNIASLQGPMGIWV